MGGWIQDINGGPGTLTMHVMGDSTDNLDNAQRLASILGDPIGTKLFQCGGLVRRGGR
jgi:hypothetical protein